MKLMTTNHHPQLLVVWWNIAQVGLNCLNLLCLPNHNFFSYQEYNYKQNLPEIILNGAHGEVSVSYTELQHFLKITLVVVH